MFFPRISDVLQTAGEFESVTGQGVVGRVAGREVALGNLRLLEGRQRLMATLDASLG